MRLLFHYATAFACKYIKTYCAYKNAQYVVDKLQFSDIFVKISVKISTTIFYKEYDLPTTFFFMRICARPTTVI